MALFWNGGSSIHRNKFRRYKIAHTYRYLRETSVVSVWSFGRNPTFYRWHSIRSLSIK